MTRIVDLSGLDATTDISVGSPEQYPYVSVDDQMTFSLSDDTVTLGSSGYAYTLGANAGVTGIGVTWSNTITGTGSYTLGSNWNNGTSAKIQLDGPDADIEINGESMIGMLRNIEQRLNILTPNPKLESEWEELKTLGDQYRALEQHILEKQATWDRLKAMPPPEID